MSDPKKSNPQLLNVTTSPLSMLWGYSGAYNQIVLDFESSLTANRLQDEGSCPLSHQSLIPWVSSPLSHFWQRSCYRISAAMNTSTGMTTFRRTTAENGKDGVQNFRCKSNFPSIGVTSQDKTTSLVLRCQHDGIWMRCLPTSTG